MAKVLLAGPQQVAMSSDTLKPADAVLQPRSDLTAFVSAQSDPDKVLRFADKEQRF